MAKRQADRSVRRRSRARDERVPAWGVSVFESHHADDFHMETRRHDFLKVLMIQSGAGRAWIAGEAHGFEAGDVVIVPIGQDNRVEDTPRAPVSLYALCVRPGVWAVDPSLPKRLPTGTITLRDPANQRLTLLLRRLLYAQTTDAPSRRAHIAGLTLQVLALIEQLGEPGAKRQATGAARAVERSHPAAAAHDETMAQYVAELAHRFYEVMTIDDEAARLRMSRRAFTGAFKRHTGRTWLHHVRELRLRHAERLLHHTRRTVTSIAFECGFGDLSTFYRAFTGEHGVSPLVYRQRCEKR